MNEEQIINQEPATTEQNYIETITKLKSSTVGRDMYDKVVAENKELLNSLVNGMPGPSGKDTAESKPSAEECRKRLFHPEKELTNVEYIERALDLREAVLEETGEDCFVGYSHLNPEFNKEDAEQKAQKVADVFEQCLEESNGNPKKFTNILQDRTNDIVLPRRKR